MARGTQHRKQRPTTNAPVASKQAKVQIRAPREDSWEDQLFFARLRRHAKWVFVLLALVFGFSFVLFGVGTGSNGFSDAISSLLQRSSSSGPSVSSAEERTRENPKDAEAWRELATALTQQERTNDAIAALATYTALKPKDEDALQELGGLYLRRSDEFAQQYAEAQSKATGLQPSEIFKPAAGSPLAQALADPIASGIATSTGAITQEAYANYIETQGKAVGVYKKLAALNPKDATNQYRLAQVAVSANNTAEAIAAYNAFLKLAPNDSLAPAARKELKRLTAAKASAATGG